MLKLTSGTEPQEKMAATRCWRFVLRSPGLSLHTAAEAAVTAPEVTGSDVKAAPVARYPPIVASLTADSKAARQRRVERWQATVHAAKSVDAPMPLTAQVFEMMKILHADGHGKDDHSALALVYEKLANTEITRD